MRACVPTWSTWQHVCVPAWFVCKRACVPKCQKRAKFSFLRANVPINVLTCQHANFSTWRAKVSKASHFFSFACQNVCQSSNYFSKELCLFIYLVNLYPIYFIYFLYFNYIPNIYFLYEHIFLPNFIYRV